MMKVDLILFFTVATWLLAHCPMHQAMISQPLWKFRSQSLKAKRGVRLLASFTEESRIASKNALVEEDDPFGPPSVLASLKVQESHIPQYFLNMTDAATTSPLIITRLSHDPDIFLARNFVPTEQQGHDLIITAQEQGLKTAGTRQSEAQSVRKSSYLTWIDPYSSTTNNAEKNDLATAAIETARVMSELSQALFVHETLLSPTKLVTCEDLQIAKYDPTGCFDFHHDGYNRFVTVLTYLNGIGGTYFPMAQTTTNNDANKNIDGASLISKLKRCNQITMDEQKLLSVESEFQVGADGLLVVGTEGEAAYSISKKSENAIVRIQPGDAIVFYNSKFRWKERKAIENYRSMHAGLRVPQEKWIATNWLRMKE